QMTSQTEFIEHALHDIEHRLSSNGKAEVIEKQQDLLNSIQMIYEKSKTIFVPTPISNDFP
ncbi:unnamed protein product, partial [Rotaria magnacalcarata]